MTKNIIRQLNCYLEEYINPVTNSLAARLKDKDTHKKVMVEANYNELILLMSRFKQSFENDALEGGRASIIVKGKYEYSNANEIALSNVKFSCSFIFPEGKIFLNERMGTIVLEHDYELVPSYKYLINLENEKEIQDANLKAMALMGPPRGIDDFSKWLERNNYSLDNMEITNENIIKYYGKEALWKTIYSQGLVVKDEITNKYYIVIECSRLNEGYQYSKIIANYI